MNLNDPLKVWPQFAEKISQNTNRENGQSMRVNKKDRHGNTENKEDGNILCCGTKTKHETKQNM